MSASSDVCLILEGTYPYVAGGVSSWVHQLISALTDVRFSLMTILPSRDYIREMKYKIPSNVVDIREVFIHDYHDISPNKTKGDKKKAFKELEKFIIEAVAGDVSSFEKIYQHLSGENPLIDKHDLLFSNIGWELIYNLYKHFNLNISFIDYFWTFRFTVWPILQVLQAKLPPAEIYHAISTGYAGMIGSVGKLQNNSVLLLTEHGIYSKERKIEISQASWIYDEKKEAHRPQETLGFFKQWWIGLFNLMGQVCYNYSSEIITLYQGNQLEQLRYGATDDKVSIIPNGIDLSGFSSEVREISTDQSKYVIGFVGRVVSIKDVKTFIKACKIIVEKLPGAEIWIMGPTDEEEEYYHDCLLLIDMLGIKDKITFTGSVNIREYYPKIDVLVLTSESEAQPLVILEANAMGVPIVASNVGACMELLNGRIPKDKELGVSGLVTGVGSPDETADAILKVLNDPDTYKLMSFVGKERVNLFYGQDDLFAKYLNLYSKYIH